MLLVGVGLVLALVVGVQLSAVRTNMAAARAENDARTMRNDAQNLRSERATRYPRPQVEAAARAAGMIIPPPNAYRELSRKRVLRAKP